MRRFLPPLAILPLLAACAQQPPAPAAGVWIGRSEAELVSALGVPDRAYETEGRRFLAYDGTHSEAGPTVVPSIGFGIGRTSGGWGSATGFGTGLGLSFGGFGGGRVGNCTTTYEIRDNRVIDGTTVGPGCG